MVSRSGLAVSLEMSVDGSRFESIFGSPFSSTVVISVWTDSLSVILPFTINEIVMARTRVYLNEKPS